VLSKSKLLLQYLLKGNKKYIIRLKFLRSSSNRERDSKSKLTADGGVLITKSRRNIFTPVKERISRKTINERWGRTTTENRWSNFAQELIYKQIRYH